MKYFVEMQDMIETKIPWKKVYKYMEENTILIYMRNIVNKIVLWCKIKSVGQYQTR